MLGTVKKSLSQISSKWRSKWQLQKVGRLEFQAENLRKFTEAELVSIFKSEEIERHWQLAKQRLQEVCRIEDLTTDGVNTGDRRAIWYLVHALRPKSILECGTHVGASTIHLASAMKSVHDATQEPWKITTLDIYDVNDGPESYWKKYGLALSPRQMMAEYGCESHVEFLPEPSLSYLPRCQDRFDFIFLAGDHTSSTVYREIQIALQRLNKNGVILLHDFFPDHRPLWKNGSMVYGPYEAAKRLKSESVPIRVIPLGKLPWETKLNSHLTSLAIASHA